MSGSNTIFNIKLSFTSSTQPKATLVSQKRIAIGKERPSKHAKFSDVRLDPEKPMTSMKVEITQPVQTTQESKVPTAELNPRDLRDMTLYDIESADQLRNSLIKFKPSPKRKSKVKNMIVRLDQAMASMTDVIINARNQIEFGFLSQAELQASFDLASKAEESVAKIKRTYHKLEDEDLKELLGGKLPKDKDNLPSEEVLRRKYALPKLSKSGTFPTESKKWLNLGWMLGKFSPIGKYSKTGYPNWNTLQTDFMGLYKCCQHHIKRGRMDPDLAANFMQYW